MENCPHLREPTASALQALRDPLNWACNACSSTDGLWCCLTCGHVGCGRRAHLPALGGGHAKHHFQTLSFPEGKITKNDDINTNCGHEVCLDIVGKAVHCYVCDEYVLSDAPWLADIRMELVALETRAPEGSHIDSGELPPSRSLTTFAPGRTGLRNLGNTCYMNSVIQMLSHCSGFRSYFRDFLRASAPLRLGEYVKISRQPSEQLKDALQLKNPPDKLALCEAMHALLRVLWSGKWPSVAPHAFVQAVWKHGGLFAARLQQDAQEFLNFVLERLDDELRPPGRPLYETSAILKDLFGVEVQNEVRCDECNTVTKRTEPLLGLVLSLPEGDDPNETISLQACLDMLLTAERLVDDNRFFCDTCNEKRDATKNIALFHRPQALLISFRRTSWSPKLGLYKDKRKVAFPLELDATEILGDDTMEEECHYRLSSVVAHYGVSSQRGHYIAWSLIEADGGDGRWYLFNDHLVVETTNEQVMQAEAYILLYERRQHTDNTIFETKSTT